MYTRYPFIASIFQKAVLLRDTKCNKIIQRRMHSEPLVKFSKIENKLKPMKRCFSGASSNRNAMHKTRSVQGVGFIRKSLPEFPREMIQQQQQQPPLAMSEPMPPNQMQHNPKSVEVHQSQSSNENKQKSGKITIVIDKNEICNCSSPNEDIQIHITTTSDATQNMRLTKALSETDLSRLSSTRCNCCPQCQAVRNSRIGNSLLIPNPTTFQPKNVMNITNDFPRRQPNCNGLPMRNFIGSVEGRSLEMDMLKKSRSMSDFPMMRKMIVPNTFAQTQQRIPQLPRTMHSSSVDPRSQVRLVSSGRNYSNQPNLQPTPNSIPNAISLSNQQTESSATVFARPNQPINSHPVNALVREKMNIQRINEINRQLRKYSSFHRNVLPLNDLANKSGDAKPNHRPINENEAGRSGPKIDKQPEQRQRITERILRPATFSSAGRVFNNNNRGIASVLNRVERNRGINSARLPNRKPVMRDGPIVTKPNLFNMQAIVNKNRFPTGRASVPTMLTFQRQNAFNAPQRSYPADVLRNVNQGGLPNGNVVRINALPVNILPNQRSPTTTSQAHFVSHPKKLNQKPFLVQRQPPQLLLKKRSELRPSVHPNHQLNKLPQSTVSLHQNSNQKRIGPAPVRANQMINFGRNNQPPQFFLKKKRVPSQRAMNPYQQKHRQPPQMPRRSTVSLPQMGRLQRNVASKRQSPQKEPPKPVRNVRKPTQTSMIPTRNFHPVREPNAFPRPKTAPLRQIPNVPIARLVNLPSRPQLNPNNLMDSTKQSRPVRVYQKQRPSTIRKMNVTQLQSSLPVVITNRPNQIVKYIEHPKSIQTAARPQSSPTNMNTPKAAIRPPRGLPPYSNAVNAKPLRMQPMPQPRQITLPTNGKESLQRERRTQPEKLIPTASPQQVANVPKVDNNSSLQKNNPAVLFYGPGQLKLVNMPVPRLADENGVIVKMLYVHLTDVDAQMLSAVQDGPYKLTQPTIAGKSGSGVVVDAGKQVDNVKVGDKVSVKGISCGKCTACENDNEVICERVPIVEKLGILKRFHAVPAKFVTKLPDTVHPIDGAMIDELSSSIRACKKSTVTAGDNVLVLGGKSLGLWTALAAKSMGATNVCLADSRPLVLEQAKKLGIDRVFLINPNSPASNTSKCIAEYMQGENPRIVFDCNGSPLTNEIAINTSLIGGKVVLMKNSLSTKPVSISDAVDREIDILSSQHGNNDSERAALQMLSSGKLQVNGIDSSFYDIANVHEAFGLLNAGTISNIFIQPSRPNDDDSGKKKSKTS